MTDKTQLTSLSRRQWLRQAGSASLVPAAAALGVNMAGWSPAEAGTSLGSGGGGSGYKALVCLFMVGGNDAYNTVLATDSASWSAYAAARGSAASGVALAAPGAAPVAGGSLHARLGGVLPITPLTRPAGRAFALHPCLGAVRDLFAAKRLAVLANVGPMVGPCTKADYFNATANRPPRLKSHNDQQSVWQSGGAEGSATGWGGRFMDALIGGNSQAQFSAISVAGNNAWLPGSATRSYQMVPAGPVAIGKAGLVYGSATVAAQMKTIMRGARDNRLIEREHAAVSARSIDAATALGSALPGVTAGPWGSNAIATSDPLLQFVDPVSGVKVFNPVAQQLQAVARTIAARDSLGMSRQVFFVNITGFDSHDSQCDEHARNMARLGQALQYFDQTLRGMGVDGQVTTFTASDFGRTLACNGDGTDHGWGGHHFVMGGAVKGGDIYGTFPTYSAPDALGKYAGVDQLDGGSLLPSTSVDQYAATLGRWLGLSDPQLTTALPNLPRYPTRNLGFMV